MDFAHSLRNSRGSGATPRGSLTNSPSSSRGSSPSHARSSSSAQAHSNRRASSMGSSSSAMTPNSYSAASDYTLQRVAISNAYTHSSSSSPSASSSFGRGDDETSSNVSESLSIGRGGGGGGGGGGPHGGGVPSPMSVSSRSGSMSGGGGGERERERGSNFKVVIRVRPPLPRELHGDRPFQNVIHVDSEGHVLTVSENLSAMGPGSSGGGNGGAGGSSGGGGNGGGNGGGGNGGGDADADGGATLAPGAYGSHVFSFDHVYDQHCTQRTVYENTAKAVVESSLEGYNATIFAYGQTGTGKTYTMEGFNSGAVSASSAVEERGIIPRAIEQIFQHIQSNMSARMRFLVRASYLQIYNESISDLLKPERNNLTIREDKKRGVFVEGLSEWVVRSPEEIYGLMERGGAMRATGSTKMNEISSRSHAVFIIIAEQSKTSYADARGNDVSAEEFTALVNAYQARHGGGGGAAPPPPSGTPGLGLGGVAPGGGGPSGAPQLHPKLESMIRQSFKVGKLNLVDLAGSERVRLSGATGQRLEESKKINQSLSALGNVIAALTDARGRQHIPYRDSKLTRILEDSLGGNCKTTMMAMISPALEAITESLSTLKFANRAKSIKNEARVNEDLDQKSLLRKYERELRRLRAELEEKSRNVVDKRRLLELDEQRRRAEEDKMAAIRALEERSREFMREKEEKKKLEQRIAMLMGQMLTSSQRRGGAGAAGGGAMADGAGGGEGLARGGMGGGGGGGVDPLGSENGDAVFLAMAGGDGFGAEDPIIREAIKEHQDRIRKEYECRLADLEKERECIEEEKAQVDRYKQLLLKQRDIMIALTQRLNERDEQITALQDELDAYDRHQKELEEKLDEKTAHLIHLQRVTMEQTGGGGGGGGGSGTSSEPSWREPLQVVAAPGATRSELLITHKQYHPASLTESLASSEEPPLLSAEEKIQELTRLVASHAADQQRQAKELDDVRAEKVSVEYLLRDRLEKLVQVEMEARMKSMAWTQQQQLQDQLHTLTSQAELLEVENRRLRSENASCSSAGGGARGAGAAGGDALVLQARCDTLVKERRAVQTIMEQKIKTLVTAISEASEATFQSAGGAEQLGEPAKWLAKEVHALQRLVNASIVALRNAESAASAASNQPGATGSAPKSSSSTCSSTVAGGHGETTHGGSQTHAKATAMRTVDLTASAKPSTSSSSFSASSSPSPATSTRSSSSATTTTSSGSIGVAGPVSTSGLSVDELIQQRRAQLQRERQSQ